MVNQSPEERWQVRMIRPGFAGLERLPLPEINRLPWLNRPVRPAEMGDGLRDALLARENMLEDVNYQKVVPNRFVVEVNPVNYARQFRPIEGQILQQWRNRLMQELITANSRQGRKEFRFGGRLHIEIRPANDLQENEGRILSRVEQGMVEEPPRIDTPASARPRVPAPASPARPAARPARQSPVVPSTAQPARQEPMPGTGASSPVTLPGPGPERPAAATAYLELAPSGQRWALYPGTNTIGRSESAQIHLSMPIVQEKRLVSGTHCYIVMDGGQCMLFDGAPGGRPSANGTYVNLRRVPPGGYRLQNGDAIVLAAIDPLYPRSDTPGVVTFYYWTGKRE